jgi:hypothetical protein
MTQNPIHPGEHLKEEMSELGMSADKPNYDDFERAEANHGR